MFNLVNTKLKFFTFFCIPFTILMCSPMISCKSELVSKESDSLLDFDLDGVLDQDDLDDDNDGIPDDIETTADIDGDGIPNHHDRDSDGDGIPDLIEATGVDKDGDGILDPWDEWEDDNHNGFHDEYENEPLVIKLETSDGMFQWQSFHKFGAVLLDQDNDGVPNFWDTDSDNDGISDRQEAGIKLDTNQMVDANMDGFDDRLVGHLYTQGDKMSRSGHPEFVRQDISLYQSICRDGRFDLFNCFPDINGNGNSLPDFLDKNSVKIKQ
ncbi:MAG: hypothetical protein K9J37_15965 [Saprospiraceae bacterium]|nr:hypothetical protein [Saprospiraceae bacterium]MCF8251409.1 hypothetical protein [Saprospiraceae bacterium]MCF8283054.1 hypothetical protein [Bacteroidales bacterium]MCF8312683.1 hypothetical protein [Saprospiraceae bacterium]MCF8441051.1 hypothetical protein [Saprospiraceae bacterium]